MWGLRGLAVVDGLVLDQMPAAGSIRPVQEAAAFRAVACQPPLYAWMEALGFWLSGDPDPLLSVLPSYVAGALAVVLVYLHGRLWHGAGLGLTAAILVGFNQNLLLRMQEATPTTLVLSALLATFLCYGWYERMTGESAHPWRWAGRTIWVVGGGLALGLALLAVGGLGLVALPIVLLHRFCLRAGSVQSLLRAQSQLRRLNWWINPGLVDGLLALGIAFLVSVPWFLLMMRSHGWGAVTALEFPPDGLLAGRQLSLLPRLIELAPVTLPLGAFGAVRAIRSAVVDDSVTRETAGGSFWVIWLAVAALARSIWPTGPQTAYDLILLVPLSLLAAQTVTDLVSRRVSVRALSCLAPATALSVAWWASADLSKATSDVIQGRADTTTLLGLHLALDLAVVSIWLIRALNRWARHRDDRQRRILAVFLLAVLFILVIGGLLEVLFRHSETRDLLSLRTVILRRNRDIPFRTVAVVSFPWSAADRNAADTAVDRTLPGGRLRFVLRTALPQLPQHDLNAIDELPNLPNGQRLIVLSGSEQRLSSAEQSKLGVEAIHPGRSGILAAYATAHHRLPRR
jgi:hypothetical protein